MVYYMTEVNSEIVKIFNQDGDLSPRNSEILREPTSFSFRSTVPLPNSSIPKEKLEDTKLI